MIKALAISLLFLLQIPFPGPGRAPTGAAPCPCTDDFNRADGGLGSNWSSSIGSMSIVSNKVNYGSGVNAAYWSANSFTADQYSEITFSGTAESLTQCDGPAARANGSGDFYWVVKCSDNVLYVQRVIGGTPTLLTSCLDAVTTNDVLRLEVSGAGATVTLEVYINGSLSSCGTFSDTDGARILSGSPAISGYAYAGSAPWGGAINAWAGGNL